MPAGPNGVDGTGEGSLAILAQIRSLLDDARQITAVPVDVTAAQAARRMIRYRSEIGRFLKSDLFADPALDILLDLFASGAERRTVRTSECAHAARIPATTSLRWLAQLEREGLIERRHDDADHRCMLVQLTQTARAALTAYLDRVTAIWAGRC